MRAHAVSFLQSQRTRLWLGTAVLALGLAVVSALVSDDPARAPAGAAPDPAKLAKLPALPGEIAAKGAAAVSLLAPDLARQANGKVPFVGGAIAAAKPFAFRGSEQDRLRAVECLASAVLYEAGDDTTGQKAVAQVVLNRVRHAAFPGTVCGVVYQGSERTTGCQFTFTCDGSLRRRMPDAAWRRARDVAERALTGAVDTAVGLATHYHTDWVYPYWSPSLNKLVRVGTHLFFGWPGNWGGPYAFLRKYAGGEPTLAAVPLTMASEAPGAEPAALAPVGGASPGGKPDQQLPDGLDPALLFGNRLRLVHPDGGAFGLLAAPGAKPAHLLKAALALCPGAGFCRVDAWASVADIPPGFPIPPPSRAKIVFEFLRDPATAEDRQRYDCARFPQVDAKLCL